MSVGKISVVIAASVLALVAQDKQEMTLRFKKGDKFVNTNKSSSDMQFGKQDVSAKQQLEVLEVDADGAATIEVKTLKGYFSTKMPMLGEMELEYDAGKWVKEKVPENPIAEQIRNQFKKSWESFKVKITKNGQTTRISKSDDDDEESSQTNNFTLEVLPKEKVGVGDTWTAELPRLGKVAFKLEKIAEEAGKKVALVKGKIDYEQEIQKGIIAKTVGEYAYCYVLDEGYISKANADLDITNSVNLKITAKTEVSTEKKADTKTDK